MTQNEIQADILRVCKVAGHDSDFNVVAFYVLCEKLKQLGVEEEREACAKMCEQTNDGTPYNLAEACAEAIRARGQA
jgi:hypothetical protein